MAPPSSSPSATVTSGPGRPWRGRRRSAPTTTSDTIANAPADCGSIPNRIPELRQWTIRTRSPISWNALADREVADDPGLGELVDDDDADRDRREQDPAADRRVRHVAFAVESASAVPTASTAARRRRSSAGTSAAAPPSSSASITGSTGSIGPPQRDAHLARLEPHAAAHRVGRRAVPADVVDERLGGHGREMRLAPRARGRRPTGRSGRRAPARPPCAGPGRRAAARGRRPRRRAPGSASCR